QVRVLLPEGATAGAISASGIVGRARIGRKHGVDPVQRAFGVGDEYHPKAGLDSRALQVAKRMTLTSIVARDHRTRIAEGSGDFFLVNDHAFTAKMLRRLMEPVQSAGLNSNQDSS